MAEESSMQINLTTTTYNSEEKPKKRKVVVSEDDSAEIAKSPEKKKSRRIQNGNEQPKHIFTLNFYKCNENFDVRWKSEPGISVGK